MQISNSNIQAAIIANQTSRKQNKVVNGDEAKQVAQSSQEIKALNKKTNNADKDLIYTYNVAANSARVSQNWTNQKDSETTLSEIDSGLQRSIKNNNKIRGTLVTENQNFMVANAIDTYARHQELEHSEHVSQVMGVDLYA